MQKKLIQKFCFISHLTGSMQPSQNLTQRKEQPVTINVEMRTPSTYRNQGKGVATKEYTAQTSIRELVQIQRPSGITAMNKVNISDTLLIQNADDLSVTIGSKILPALRNAYNFESWPSSPASETFKKEEKAEFAVFENIEIPPCSTLTVTSYVKLLQKYPVDYWFLAQVRGKMGLRKLTALELKNEIDGMEFVEDVDEHTIIVRGHGSALADLGVETNVESQSGMIEGCIDFTLDEA